MNNLNSVVIEGIILNIYDSETKNVFSCVIESHNKNGNTAIIIKGEDRLAVICNDNLTIGKKIRVVGTLRFNNPDYYIQANHVEFQIGKTNETGK